MNRSKRLFTLIVTGWTKHAMATNTGITQRATYWGEIYTWFIPLLRWNIHFIHPITEVKYTLDSSHYWGEIYTWFIPLLRWNIQNTLFIPLLRWNIHLIHPITEVKYILYSSHYWGEIYRILYWSHYWGEIYKILYSSNYWGENTKYLVHPITRNYVANSHVKST